MKSKIKKTHYLLFLPILLGAFLRFYNLGEFSFSADEFLDINSTYGYHQTREWQAWDFNLGEVEKTNAYAPRDERAWIYKWQVAQLFNFLPPTEATARTVSVLWGLLSIVAIYFVSLKFTKKPAIGLLSAFLLAVSLDAIEFSRMLRMYAMFFPIFLLFSWALFEALEKQYTGKMKFRKFIWEKLGINSCYLLLTILLGALSLHLHLLTVNILFVLAAYLLVMTFLKRKSTGAGFNRYFNKYFVFFSLGVLGFILAFLLAGDKLQSATKEIGFGINHFSYLDKTFSDYASPLLALGFILLGSFYLWKVVKLKKESLWLSLSFWGILFLAIFFWDRNVGNQYIFLAQSFKIILLSSGIYFLATFLRENLKNKNSRIYATVIVLSLILVPAWGYFLRNENFYHQTSDSNTPQYRKIFTYFKKKKGEKDVLITRNFRNYYFSGENIPVFNLGGERSLEKLTLERLQQIIQENPTGWIILSGNDEIFVTKEAEEYITQNLEKVSNSQVRGDISVYRWEGPENSLK